MSYLAALIVLSQTGLLVLVSMGCKEPEALLPARLTSPAAKPAGPRGDSQEANPEQSLSLSSCRQPCTACIPPCQPHAPICPLLSFYGEGDGGSALTAAQLMRTFVDRTPLPHPLDPVPSATAMNRPPYTRGENNLSHSFNAG